MAADQETPKDLIWFEPPPNGDLARLAPHFQQQLLEQFNVTESYSLEALAKEISVHVEDSLTKFCPNEHTAPFSGDLGRMRLDLSLDNVVKVIKEKMVEIRKELVSLDPSIRKRMAIIGRYGVNPTTGGNLSLICKNMDDIRAAYVYRFFMPCDLPVIHVVLDLDSTNGDRTSLEDEAKRLDLVVDEMPLPLYSMHEKYKEVKPWLYVVAPKANDAVQFYKTAFGAEEVSRTTHRKRKAEQELPLLISAELKLGYSSFFVSDHSRDNSETPVEAVGSGGFALCLVTEEVDAAIEKAVGAGAVVESVNEADGKRVVNLKDPYGYAWLICAPEEDPAEAEA